MIDEAHSLGRAGADTAAASASISTSIRRDVDVWMGTMSKSLGSCGGYIAGCKELIEYLKYTAPGFVFSVGLPPAGGRGRAGLDPHCSRPSRERVARLQENAAAVSHPGARARPEHRHEPGIRRSCR